MTNRFILMALFCLAGLKGFSQPSSTYLSSVNSYLPGSPESTQMMKYQDYPVNLFTGTPEISVPIYTCSGKGISVPINISYHAGGGVKVSEFATPVGLGFSLMAGGQITRDMRGGPDEGGTGPGGLGTSGFMSKPNSMQYYINKYNCCTGLGAGVSDQQLWVDAMNGKTDLEPDIFYFSFGGYSGKFVWSDSLNNFVFLTENSHMRIAFDKTTPATFFTITTDDGNKYIFKNRETSYSTISNRGTAQGNGLPGVTQTTAWKLSTIINADGTDSIWFNYSAQLYTYYSDGSSISYEGAPGRQDVVSFSANTIGGEAHLSNISGKNFSVDFVDESADRLDATGNKALSQIIIKNGNNEIQDIFSLHHSYFSRAANQGTVIPIIGNAVTKSLRLDSISEYGNSVSNSSPLRYAFSYDPQQLPGRLSFAQDWWGYPNSNTYTGSLIPTWYSADGIQHLLADRTPDLSKVTAGILTGIRLPTGGTVTYEYEPNTTALPVTYSKPDEVSQIPVIQLCREERDGTTVTWNDTSFYFTINEPYNAINGYQGGVDANISVTPGAPAGTPLVTYGYIWYYLYQVTGPDLVTPPTNPFIRNIQVEGFTNVHLPNGKYQIGFHDYGYSANAGPNWPTTPTGVWYDDGRPSGQMVSMSVGYAISDTSGNVANYSLAGVRVKKITTMDQYSNITNTRTFHYHKPENDSSYGAYLGSVKNTYDEVSQNGTWQVFMGSFNLPGMGNNSSMVIYPKVIEDVDNNGITYRTEHYYTRGAQVLPMYSSGYPFVPEDDIESERGNEYQTVFNKFTSGSYTPAQIKKQVFDSFPRPLSNPNTFFGTKLYGIRCAAATYDQGLVITNGYAPPYVSLYPISVNNRTYLMSDSTITYDLNNQYLSVKQWHDYKYGDYNHQLLDSRTGNSDGSIIEQKNYYATDSLDANPEVAIAPKAQIISSNRITQILGEKKYKDGNLLSQQYNYGRFEGNRFLLDSVREALFNNPLDAEVKVQQYDNYGNPTLIALRGGKFRKYIWNTDRNLPLATCVTSQNAFFYFTSFEYPSDNGVSGSAFSGASAYPLSSANTLTIPSSINFTDEDVYVWATSPSFTINGVLPSNMGKNKGIWTLYKVRVPNTNSSVPSNIVIASSTSLLLDQLIVFPSGSSFQGNVYDNTNRVIAAVNNQIMTTFYEYDAFGRLFIVRDEDGNILKSTSYQYQAAQ